MRCTRAIGSVVERLVHTEEVTGSNPVSPTDRTISGPAPGQGRSAVGIDDIVAKAREEADADHAEQVQAVTEVIKDRHPDQVEQILSTAAKRASESG